MALQAGTV